MLVGTYNPGEVIPYLFPRLTKPMIVDTRFLLVVILFKPQYFCFSIIPASLLATLSGKLRLPVLSVRCDIILLSALVETSPLVSLWRGILSIDSNLSRLLPTGGSLC
jgi:hypothetical protein